MQRRWGDGGLAHFWGLSDDETSLVQRQRPQGRLGLAVQLKYFQIEGRFPRTCGEVPLAGVDYLAHQLRVPLASFYDYNLKGRTAERHHALLRDFLGFRSGTAHDAQVLEEHLQDTVLPFEHRYDRVLERAEQWCREHQVMSSREMRVERVARASLQHFETRFQTDTYEQLSDDTKQGIDRLLVAHPATQGETEGFEISAFGELKTGPGAPKLKTIAQEIDKLRTIDDLALPDVLFDDAPRKLIQLYRRRAAVQPPRELRNHPPRIRYSLVSAFVWQRRREITDTLVELMIRVIHNIHIRAEVRVVQVLLQDIRQVRGKGTLLYRMANAALANPDQTIRDVIYPLIGEETLNNIVKEHEASGPAYRAQVQRVMRSSYSHHYRRMLPMILDTLEFHSNNRAHRPVINALEWLRLVRESPNRQFPLTREIPVTGIVPESWEDFVFEEDAHGTTQVNRISYELCVLDALRERVRVREIWVTGGERFGDPDKDLPSDFQTKRTAYCELLELPIDAKTFIGTLNQKMSDALTNFNDELPNNPKVKIIERARNRIRVSPFPPAPEPPQIDKLKAELTRQWPMTSLLDILKETDLRVGFTKLFRSVGNREIIPRDVLQRRLLMSLFALGTNAGMKALSSGTEDTSYADLLYVRRRFIDKELLRAAVGQVIDAALAIRHTDIWGEGTTACASDSKRMGAWDQNLMTEWHARYAQPGVMIYWHVERKSLCIHCQPKRCSSSEVAAMLEGVLRHCSEVEVEKNYVDSHGQSEVGFGLCYLLGFDLLPRLKAIAAQKLYRPTTGRARSYPNLQPIMSKAIR